MASKGNGGAKRAYRMENRAEAAAETGRNILRATMECYGERFFDQVSLEDIAERAGVTVQTILRRFGTKEDLISAAAAEARPSLRSQRDQTPAGDVAGAIRVLVHSYEEHGDRVLRLLAQEERVAPFRQITDAGRTYHQEWVKRVFAPHLKKCAGARRQRLQGKLVAICDLYVWKVLRRDLGFSREEVESSLIEMVRDVIAASQPSGVPPAKLR